MMARFTQVIDFAKTFRSSVKEWNELAIGSLDNSQV